MKLKKIIRTIILSAFLGITFSGMTVFAIENENDRKIDYYNKTVVCTSKGFAEYYNKMKTERKLEDRHAWLQTCIFFQKLMETCDTGLSDVYATLEIEKIIEKDRMCAAEATDGKDGRYIEYYVDLRKGERALDEKSARAETDIYVDLVSSNKSKEYAKCYSRLKVEMNLEDKYAVVAAKKYEEKIKGGSSEVEALLYVKSLLLKKIQLDKIRDIYYEEKKSGKDEEYIKHYIKLIINGSEDKETARKRADIYYQMIQEGESAEYAEYCSKLVDVKELDEDQTRLNINDKLKEKEKKRKAKRKLYINKRIKVGKKVNKKK